MGPEEIDFPTEAMGERPALDPFNDDAPLECGLDSADICESCQ